jgi:hypothetical protein
MQISAIRFSIERVLIKGVQPLNLHANYRRLDPHGRSQLKSCANSCILNACTCFCLPSATDSGVGASCAAIIMEQCNARAVKTLVLVVNVLVATAFPSWYSQSDGLPRASQLIRPTCRRAKLCTETTTSFFGICADIWLAPLFMCELLRIKFSTIALWYQMRFKYKCMCWNLIRFIGVPFHCKHFIEWIQNVFSYCTTFESLKIIILVSCN